MFKDFLFIVVLLSLFILSLWMIDVSSSALVVGGRVKNISGIDTDPNFTYHLGFIISIIVYIITISYLFYIRLTVWMKESFGDWR